MAKGDATTTTTGTIFQTLHKTIEEMILIGQLRSGKNGGLKMLKMLFLRLFKDGGTMMMVG